MTTKNPTPRKSTSTRSRKTPPAAAAAVPDTLQNAQPPLDEAIARLAHRLYLERGGAHGHDVDDWLEAERRIKNGS